MVLLQRDVDVAAVCQHLGMHSIMRSAIITDAWMRTSVCYLLHGRRSRLCGACICLQIAAEHAVAAAEEEEKRQQEAERREVRQKLQVGQSWGALP